MKDYWFRFVVLPDRASKEGFRPSTFWAFNREDAKIKIAVPDGEELLGIAVKVTDHDGKLIPSIEE